MGEMSQELASKTKTHPCYNSCAGQYARMHIPVAPKCNISCNYCNRKFDCLHESRPGVTSEVLSPKAALEKYKIVKEKVPNLTVVGIAGPGDALANFEKTKESIELIKKEDPNATFCLSTNGLMLPKYAKEIIDLGISHITITINTIDPEIGAQIYKEVYYQGQKLTGVEGARVLLENQLEGLRFLSEHDVLCKVNIVMIKGINEDHIEHVVKKVKEYGVFMTNIMPLIPAEGSVFENMPLVSNVELNALRKKCSIDLKQMYHCKQCRADAIGVLSEDRSAEFRNIGCPGSKKQEEAKEELQKQKEWVFAVASKTGKLIDQHFGHVKDFLIYKYNEEGIRFLEKRPVDQYCNGVDECGEKKNKMENIIELLGDCNAVLSMRIGYEPKKKLVESRIQSVEVYDTIEKGIQYAVEKLKVIS